MTEKLRRDLKVVCRALSLEPNPNYRFSTWGEFNESYLSVLTDQDQEQYWRLVQLFAIIHEHYKNGHKFTIHCDIDNYRKIVYDGYEELKKW